MKSTFLQPCCKLFTSELLNLVCISGFACTGVILISSSFSCASISFNQNWFSAQFINYFLMTPSFFFTFHSPFITSASFDTAEHTVLFKTFFSTETLPAHHWIITWDNIDRKYLSQHHMQMILHETEFSITEFYISSADSWFSKRKHLWGESMTSLTQSTFMWLGTFTDSYICLHLLHVYIYVYIVYFLSCNYLPSTLFNVELCEEYVSLVYTMGIAISFSSKQLFPMTFLLADISPNHLIIWIQKPHHHFFSSPLHIKPVVNSMCSL